MFQFKKRRPIWQPSRFSQAISVLKSLLKKITFKGVVAAVKGVVAAVGTVFVLLLLFYVYREVRHDALVIDSFSIPKNFEESGLTPEVVSNRIGDAIRRIETDTRTRMKKDKLTSLRDEGAMPDVEIPGTQFGLKALVGITREVFTIHPKHVSGDIVALKNPEPQLKVSVYITEGRNRSQAASLLVNSNEMDEVAQRTAETVLEQVNPYILAKYLNDHGEFDRVITLIRYVVQDESKDRGYRAAAITLWGRMLADTDRKKYDEAIDKYKQASALDPKYTSTYIDWGNALSDQKKYGEAIDKYKQASALDPKYEAAYNNWGYALFAQGKYDEAIDKYKQAIALDPKYALAYKNWGNALTARKKYDEALDKYKQANELDPGLADAYYKRGRMLSDQKKYDEAINEYKQAIALEPKDAAAYNNWGNALTGQQKYGEAIDKYKQALALEPKYAVAYNNWGNALTGQKKYDEAIEKYKQATVLDPEYALAYNNWGNALRIQRKYEEAEEKFAQARVLSQ